MQAIRCTNSEPGTFNHECGRPALYAGTHASGHVQYFCADCRSRGYEARHIKAWRDLQAAPAEHS